MSSRLPAVRRGILEVLLDGTDLRFEPADDPPARMRKFDLVEVTGTGTGSADAKCTRTGHAPVMGAAGSGSVYLQRSPDGNGGDPLPSDIGRPETQLRP